MFASGGLLDRDVVAEGFQLAQMATYGPLGMSPKEVVRPELVVRHPVAHDVVRDLEDLVSHGDDGFLMASLALHAMIPGLQGRVLLVHGAEGGLDQRGTEVPIAFAGLATAPFSRTLVLPRTHRAPAAQVARRGEPLHVAARLSHDADRAHAIHARNRVQRSH